MTDEQKQPIFKWVAPKEPKPEIYTNFMHASWTLYDVRFQFGQLIPAAPGVSNDFLVEEQIAVTLPWAQAKNLRDLLIRLVESYEKANGEIKPLNLTPAPDLPTPPAVAPIQPAIAEAIPAAKPRPAEK